VIEGHEMFKFGKKCWNVEAINIYCLLSLLTIPSWLLDVSKGASTTPPLAARYTLDVSKSFMK